MTETETAPTDEKLKQKRGRPVGSQSKFPGLRDDVLKVFQDRPDQILTKVDIYRTYFPEASYPAVSDHINKHCKRRSIVKVPSVRGGYQLASLEHRAMTNNPIAAKALKSVGFSPASPLPQEVFERQIHSLALRLSPVFFTDADFNILSKAMTIVSKVKVNKK